MNRPILAAAILAMAATGVAPALARPFTQRDLVAMERAFDPRLSPDGRWVLYGLGTLDAKGTGSTNAIMKVAADGKGAPVQIALGSSARWSADGRRIFFLAPAGTTRQVWSVAADGPGEAPLQVSALPLDVSSFRLSPDGRRLVVSMAVPPGRETGDAIQAWLAERAGRKASGRLFDRLPARHWDSWRDESRNHLFALTIGTDGRAAGEPVALTPRLDSEIPARPFNDDNEYAIAPDSRSVFFSVRAPGEPEAWTINYDLWRVPIDGGAAPENLTADNPAWDTAPVFSRDGRRAAHRATKRPGFEADRFGIVLGAPPGEQGREVAPGWDRSADQIAFSGDGESLYVRAGDVQHVRIFRIDIASGAVTPLTGEGRAGMFDVARTAAGDLLAFTRESMAGPPQVVVMKPGGDPVQLTHVGAQRLKGVELSPYESFSYRGWNEEVVRGWIVKPHGWTPGRKFPALFLVHGGPQGSWNDSWSTRWNPQVFAGWGYGVVLVDFHGSSGYGQAFTDSISRHWGDRPLEDLKRGWAAAQKAAPWIDASRTCQGGNSYGGFMTYLIAGVWNEPWKCQISHDGIFDLRMMGYATDELWPNEWDIGPPPWTDPASYERFNPVNHVKNWSKPMLVIHSERDFRVPLEQGHAAFTALQRKGIESQFLTFPDEAHFVVKPANSLMWHDVVEAWLKRWIG